MVAAFRARIPALACVVILCIMIFAGLSPFHAPKNDVTWLPGERGVYLGRYNAIMSSASFNAPDSCSIEFWGTPGDNPETEPLLAFSTADNPFRFSLRQFQSTLILKRELPGLRRSQQPPMLGVEGIFEKGKPAFIAATLSPEKTAVYLDGKLVKTMAPLPSAADSCTGQLVLGGSPVASRTWTGHVRGLAIYRTELSADRVAAHDQSWTNRSRPELAAGDHAAAVYLFHEGSGRAVHNDIRSGPDLFIPPRYQLLRQYRFQPPWDEFRPNASFALDTAVNIFGFMPLGWCFCGYLTLMWSIKRPASITILLGFATSLTIEITQSFLPTRASGTTDLFTNTLGACLGVMVWRSEFSRRMLSAVNRFLDERTGTPGQRAAEPAIR